MPKLRAKLGTSFKILLAMLALAWSAPAFAQSAARVIINGTPSPVYFNDGDSFRVLGGPYKTAKARLAGFNTLESHGPVHSWGTWTEKEMYVIAKMATANARNGEWTCHTDKKTDTYGRWLMWCPDLAYDQVRKGLAHAMSVTDAPAKAMLLRAQREAIKHRRGIWAHGVPPFVLTSIHSVEEDVSGRGTYNRLVSTGDGHSAKWKHYNSYSECQKVCHQSFPVDPAQVDAAVAKLKQDPSVAKAISSHPLIRRAVHSYARFRVVMKPYPKKHRIDLKETLDKYAKAGMFGNKPGKNLSCMVHVVFKRRYGSGRASCLK